MTGATGGTPTTPCRAAMPWRFVHVRVNVVTCVIVTVVATPLVTAPTPLSIVHVGSGSVGCDAYVHVQVIGVATPEVTCDGAATNDVISGISPGASSAAPSPPASCEPLPPPLHAASAIASHVPRI